MKKQPRTQSNNLNDVFRISEAYKTLSKCRKVISAAGHLMRQHHRWTRRWTGLAEKEKPQANQ